MSESTWLTSHEACDYLRYTGKHRLRSLYQFIADKGIATARRGTRRLLIARADLEKAIGARHAR